MAKTLHTRKEVEQMLRDASRDRDVLQLALSDVLAGDVKWFGHVRAFSIGITRPKSASGGIAIVRQNGTICAGFFEPMAAEMLAQVAACITGTDTPYNRELAQRREAIESAWAHVRQVHAAL